MTKKTEHHSAFQFIRSEFIDALNVDVIEYEHKVTGAKHYHIAADNDENVFLVGLKTVPTDSCGVAHILEHTVLCGSERFPVRDPFFMMIRRSLNTFMNAFTSSDWTAYPFASKNKKDFNNLLDVYLDAVFFSRLDKLDFMQEGHRLEFEDMEDPSSDLQFKGVVFNEMKGAMSSTNSVLWQTLTKYLFPNNTYHFNSGGEPADIPDLSYEDLLSFYKTHYHPTNAIFMTFGNMPVLELQTAFEDKVLSRFERLDYRVSVEHTKRYFSPVRVEESYASDEEKEKGSHVVVGWLLGESTDLAQQIEADLLSSVLLDSSASPLRHALEGSSLGNSPSPLCGLEDSNKEMSFMCGLEGVRAQDSQQVEELVLSTLREVVKNGVPHDMVEAMLHQLEMSQREIGGDHYPYGLQLILSGLSTAVHDGDVISHLDVEPVISELRERIQEKDYITHLIQTLLLDNPHRVTLTLSPDASISSRRTQAEKSRLAMIKASLSEAQKQDIIEQSVALQKRQSQEDDMSILPKVGLEDVPAELPSYPSSLLEASLPICFYPQGTNGLAYEQLIIDLPLLSEDEIKALPIFSYVLTELGVADKSYVEMQAEQVKTCGGLGAYTSIRPTLENKQDVRAYFVLSSKAIVSKFAEMSVLLKNTFMQVKFDETNRIKELVAQRRARREQSVTGQGHSLAMLAASSGVNGFNHQQELWGGISGIKALKQLDDSFQEEASIADLVDVFKSIHTKLMASSKRLLLVAEAQNKDALTKTLQEVWQDTPAGVCANPFKLKAVEAQKRVGWLTSSEVNFCAKSYQTVSGDHPDIAPLTVLGGFLRNGFLHRVIREQGGAYGGGASFDATSGAFRFYSYRDPRLAETLLDFDESIQWLLSNEHSNEALEEAVLGVIGSMDKSGSPAGDAQADFFLNLHCRTKSQREIFRARVLDTSIEQLKEVARRYLIKENESVAVISSSNNEDVLESLGLELNTL